MKEKKVLTPKDEEFKKLFAAATTHIGYCETHPYSPICEEDEEDYEEEWWWEDDLP